MVPPLPGLSLAVGPMSADQTGLPVPASSRTQTSLLPSATNRYAPLPATANAPSPGPTLTSHATLGPPVGHFLRVSVVVPSWLAPRYCGQSAATAAAEPMRPAVKAVTRVRIRQVRCDVLGIVVSRRVGYAHRLRTGCRVGTVRELGP